MGALAVLVVCLGLGVLVRRTGRAPSWSVRALNGWVLGVALPALVLHSIPGLRFEGRVFVAAGALWGVFAVAAVAALVAVRWGGVPRARAGALALTAGLCNTSFVGVPLLRALAGEPAVPYAVAVDQLGSFLALPVLALPLAAFLSGKRLGARELLARVVAFPPLLALLAAVALRGVQWPAAVLEGLHLLSWTLSPVALFAVGLQLELRAARGLWRELAAGLTYKLLAAPALTWALLAWTGSGFDLLERVAVCQAAMAPMVTGAVLASQRDLEPGLASLMVGVGVPLSLATVPVWWLASAWGAA